MYFHILHSGIVVVAQLQWWHSSGGTVVAAQWWHCCGGTAWHSTGVAQQWWHSSGVVQQWWHSSSRTGQILKIPGELRIQS